MRLPLPLLVLASTAAAATASPAPPAQPLSLRGELYRKSSDSWSNSHRRHGDDGNGDNENDVTHDNDSTSHASGSIHDAPGMNHSSSTTAIQRPPPEHAHSHSHAAPLLELNETEVLIAHSPDPPSYWSYDFGDDGPSPGRTWSGFMILHVASMSLAFFGALPIVIILRSTRHPWRGAVQALFLSLIAIGWIASVSYNKLTPNLYEGSTHGSTGYLALFVATTLVVIDALSVVSRVIAFIKGPEISLRAFWRRVVRGSDLMAAAEYEYSGLMEEPEQMKNTQDEFPPKSTSRHISKHQRSRSSAESPEWSDEDNIELHSASDRRHPVTKRFSIGSEQSETATLHDPPSPTSYESEKQSSPPVVRGKRSFLRRLGSFAFGFTERFMIFFAYTLVLSGITIYTGICRENYLNGCLAHLIKGSIFLIYGITSFARYLGGFSDLGWAWNRVPRSPSRRRPPTAEMVESSVIFLYGVTNIWMERFGAAPGSPYSTKQVQHISIAAMYWFVGIIGMALESGVFRSLLSAPALHADSRSPDSIAEPPSYRASFNPFPALVIGVTGAAMSAHHQTYLFQVQIHALWGYFLVAFAVLRCLTYFFLWLQPPRSTLPSRPPTEALASFFLACGGLTFILSTEQIGFAAMRQGHDDVMMFLNLVIAVISLIFSGCLALLTFRGLVVTRLSQSRFKSASFISNPNSETA